MKKFVSTILVFILLISLGAGAFAEEVSDAVSSNDEQLELLVVQFVESEKIGDSSLDESSLPSEVIEVPDVNTPDETEGTDIDVTEEIEEVDSSVSDVLDATEADASIESDISEEVDAEDKIGDGDPSTNSGTNPAPYYNETSTRPSSYTSQTYCDPDGYTLYLAGLGEKLSETDCQNIMNGLKTVGNYMFYKGDLNLIDAEKQNVSLANQDHLLCWAASSSDMLEYTGWAQLVNGADNVDTVFSDYRENFIDDISTQYAGIKWFFDGVYIEQYDSDGSKVKDLTSGGYLKDYCADTLLTQYDATGTDGLCSALNELYSEQSALGLAVNYESGGGHALTIFGYVLDSSSNPVALIIADSDNTDGDSFDPAQSRLYTPNSYTAYSLGVDNGRYTLNNYAGSITTYLSYITALKKYNSSIAIDTGTKDTSTSGYFDLLVSNIYVLDSNGNATDSFETGDSIFTGAGLKNYSYAPFTKGTEYNYVYMVYNENGELLYKSNSINLSDMIDEDIAGLGSTEFISSGNVTISNPGTYYISWLLNSDNNSEIEAYLNNNTSSKLVFVVKAKYIPAEYYSSTTPAAKTGTAKFSASKGKFAKSALLSPFSVFVNNKKLDSSMFTLILNDEGCLELTISDEYLSTLEAGTYTVKLCIMDQEFEAELII